MLKLEVLPLLFAVLTLATAQIGPFHSAVDDYGQAYVASPSTPPQISEVGPYQTYFKSEPFAISGPNSALIFVASNSGRYTSGNPAAFILSSDPSPNTIVSDSSWYCKGFGATAGVSQADWPKTGNANQLIVDALKNDAYKQWPKAVVLDFYGSYGNQVVENIPLQAKYIWAAGLEPGSEENPPRNVICIKSLA